MTDLWKAAAALRVLMHNVSRKETIETLDVLKVNSE